MHLVPLEPSPFAVAVKTRSPLGQPPRFDAHLPAQILRIAKPDARHLTSSSVSV